MSTPSATASAIAANDSTKVIKAARKSDGR